MATGAGSQGLAYAYQAWGEFDDTFALELEHVAGKPGNEPLDAIFVRMNASADLEKLKRAKELITQNGMIWAIWPKGRSEFRDAEIRDYIPTLSDKCIAASIFSEFAGNRCKRESVR